MIAARGRSAEGNHCGGDPPPTEGLLRDHRTQDRGEGDRGLARYGHPGDREWAYLELLERGIHDPGETRPINGLDPTGDARWGLQSRGVDLPWGTSGQLHRECQPDRHHDIVSLCRDRRIVTHTQTSKNYKERV